MKWIDMHCDTISELQKRKGESLHRNQLCVDVERLKRAGAEAQFFACFVNAADYGGKKEDWMEPCKAEKGHRSVVPSSWDPAYENVLNMISSARKAEDHSFTVAVSEQELDQARGDGRLAGILTLEEGGVLNGNIERVKELYEEGIRLITLTWNYENCLGSPNSRDPEVMSRGLKPFGKEVVERMNDLGMLIDVSHLSDGGFWDCIKVSCFPIVASHSNARALCPHPRNLTDEMLHALGNKGGVAGMNFYSAFLRKMDRNRPMSDGNDRASLMDIALHGARILDQAGEDALALGTDLDGFERDSLPYGIRDVRDMEKVWEELKRAGLTERQIEKAAGENVRRVIHEVWKG